MIEQPQSNDLLSSPDHAALHRVIAADTAATVKTIQVSTTQTIISAPADGVTGIQFNKADQTTNVMTIDTTNGRVGIGTGSPSEKLEVIGSNITTDNSIRLGVTSGRYWDITHKKYTDGSNSDYRLDFISEVGVGENTRMVIEGRTGSVGIGTTNPTNLLSLGGNSARTFWTERNTVANTAGNNLTVCVGGATVAATDKNGGDLLLASGIATGSGYSSVKLQAVVAGASGTADRTVTTHLEVGNNKIGFLGVTPVAKQTYTAVSDPPTQAQVTAIRDALVNLGLITA